MKTETPLLDQVASDPMRETEVVRGERETPTAGVECALPNAAGQRNQPNEFLRRGAEAIGETRRAGGGISAVQVISQLEARLQSARQKQAQRT